MEPQSTTIPPHFYIRKSPLLSVVFGVLANFLTVLLAGAVLATALVGGGHTSNNVILGATLLIMATGILFSIIGFKQQGSQKNARLVSTVGLLLSLFPLVLLFSGLAFVIINVVFFDLSTAPTIGWSALIIIPLIILWHTTRNKINYRIFTEANLQPLIGLALTLGTIPFAGAWIGTIITGHGNADKSISYTLSPEFQADPTHYITWFIGLALCLWISMAIAFHSLRNPALNKSGKTMAWLTIASVTLIFLCLAWAIVGVTL